MQGVWFRAWTEREATALGLAGWVRNAPDGSVAALLAGPPAAVEAMLAALWTGPPDARVTRVDVEEADPTDAPEGFAVLR